MQGDTLWRWRNAIVRLYGHMRDKDDIKEQQSETAEEKKERERMEKVAEEIAIKNLLVFGFQPKGWQLNPENSEKSCNVGTEQQPSNRLDTIHTD